MRAQSPRTWQRFFESKLFFIGGLALLVLFSINLTRAQLKDRAIRAEILKLQGEVEALTKEQQGYAALIALLETPDFLEKEARRSLGYLKPGEQVVVVEPQDKQDTLDKQDKRLSNPRKWWVYFFGGS